jgi:mono/diheme cytochrome c family protein
VGTHPLKENACLLGTTKHMRILIAIAAILVAGLGQIQAAGAKEIWTKDCAKCHGKEGRGDTKMGKKLDIKDLAEPKAQASFTDEQAFKTIKEGVKVEGKEKMKAFGAQLSDQEIKALVTYVRSLKKS